LISRVISAWIWESSIVEPAGGFVSMTAPPKEPWPIVCVGVLYSVSQSKYALLVISP
jgi:hypothetical protein